MNNGAILLAILGGLLPKMSEMITYGGSLYAPNLHIGRDHFPERWWRQRQRTEVDSAQNFPGEWYFPAGLYMSSLPTQSRKAQARKLALL